MSTVPPLQSLLDNPRYGELQPDQKVEALRAWEKDEIERRNTSGDWDLESRANFEVETRRARQAALGIEPQSPEEILKGVIEDENDPEAAQVWDALDEVQSAERDQREINRRRIFPWMREDEDATLLEAAEGRITAAKSQVAEAEIEQARLGAEALQGKRDAAVVRGKLVVNPELYYDRERYVAAVNASSATPREKARALSGFYRGREETAKAALPKLRGVGAFRSFADTYATENPDATNGDVVEAFRKSGAGEMDKWYESISSGFLSAMEGVGYLGFAGAELQKRVGQGISAVGLDSVGKAIEGAATRNQTAILGGLGETSETREFSAERVQTLGGASTAQQYGQVGGQLFGQVALTMLSGPMSSIGKTAAGAATKKALAAEVGKKLGVGGMAKKWGKETVQTMFSPAGVMAGASSAGPALYESYERNRTKLAAEGLTGPELEEAARGEAFVDATRSALITSTITSLFGLRGVEGVGRLTQVAANPAAREVIKKTVKERWGEVGLGVLSEGAEEALDEGINGGLDALLENPDMTFEDWQKATLFAGSAGALFGGGTEGVTQIAEAAAERVKNSPEILARQQTVQSLRASGLNQTADALEQANVVAETDAVAAAIDEVEARAVGAVERLDAIDTELVELAKTPGTEAKMAELEAERDSLNEALMIGRDAMRNYDPVKTANIAVADVVAEGVEPEEARRRVTEIMNAYYQIKPVPPKVLAAQALAAPAPTDTQQANEEGILQTQADATTDETPEVTSAPAPVSPVTPVKAEPTFRAIAGRPAMVDNEAGDIRIDEDGTVLLDRGPSAPPIIVSRNPDSVISTSEFNVTIDEETEADLEQARVLRTTIGGRPTPRPIERPAPSSTFVRDDGTIVTSFSGERGPVAAVTDFVSEGETEAGDLFVTVKDRETGSEFELHGDDALTVAVARRDSSRDTELTEAVTAAIPEPALDFDRVLVRMIGPKANLLAVVDRIGTDRIVSQQRLDAALDELTSLNTEIENENFPEDIRTRLLGVVDDAFNDIANVRARVRQRPETPADRGTPAPATPLTGGAEETVDRASAESPATSVTNEPGTTLPETPAPVVDAVTQTPATEAEISITPLADDVVETAMAATEGNEEARAELMAALTPEQRARFEAVVPDNIEGRAVTVSSDGRWRVQTEENRQRAEQGLRQIGGDRIFDTREEAEIETRKEIEIDRQDAESRARQEAETSAREAAARAKAAPLKGYLDDAGFKGVSRARVESTLSAPKNLRNSETGKVYNDTRFNVIQAVINDGGRVEAKSGKKTEFRLYSDQDTFWILNKTEYDAGLWIMSKNEPTDDFPVDEIALDASPTGPRPQFSTLTPQQKINLARNITEFGWDPEEFGATKEEIDTTLRDNPRVTFEEKLVNRDAPANAAPTFEIVRTKELENLPDDDGYFYHVTTKGSASQIVETQELTSANGQTMANGFYRQYSAGKVFLTDAGGVGYWMGRISDHLEAQGRNGRVVVLRVPKRNIQNTQIDELGTADSRQPAWYVEGSVRPVNAPSLEAAPATSFTEDSDWQDVTNALLDRAIAKYPKIPVTKDASIPAPARTMGLRILVNPTELARYTEGMEVADAAEMIEKIFIHEATHRHAVAEVGDNTVVEYANTMTADERTDVAFAYLHRSAYPSDEAYLKAVNDFAAVDPNLSPGERRVRLYRLGHEALRMNVERLTSGYTTEETLAFLQTNPGNLQRFLRYLGAYLRRLKQWFNARKDPAIGVEVRRLAKVIDTLTKGETVSRGPVNFDPSAQRRPVRFQGRPMMVEAPAVGLEAPAYHGTPHKWAPETLWRLTDGRTEWIVDGDPVPAGSKMVRKAPAGRVRADKVGTGEGAAAYGWGVLYAAEDEGVAKYYRDVLSTDKAQNQRRWAWKGNVERQEINEILDEDYSWKNRDELIAMLRQRATDFDEFNDNPDRTNDYRTALDLIERGEITVTDVDMGLVLSLDLKVDQDLLLDWDKPLSEQSDKVKETLGKVSLRLRPSQMLDAFLMTDFALSFPNDSEVVYAKKVKEDPDYGTPAAWVERQTKRGSKSAAYNLIFSGNGGSIYEQVGIHLATMSGARGSAGAKAISEFLLSLGIQGIRYADQNTRFSVPQKRWHISPLRPGVFQVTDGVRGPQVDVFTSYEEAEAWVLRQPDANQRTYNYVIFDPDLIEVTGVNGEPVSTEVRDEALGLDTAPVGVWNKPKAGQYVPGGGLTAAHRWDRRVYKMLEAARGEYSGYMKKAEFAVKQIARLMKDLNVSETAVNAALGNTENRLTQADVDQIKAIKKRGLAAAQGAYLSARNKAKALDAAGMFADAALARQDAKAQFDLDVKTYQTAAANYEARARRAAAAKAYADRQAAMAALPKPLADEVANLRTEIDLLSDRMIAEGDLSAELKATISANKELWLHRSYQIFDDPNYVAWIKEQKDPEAVRLRNKTINFLRQDLVTRKVGELMASGMNRTAATAQAQIDVTDDHVKDAFDDYLMVADNGSKTLLTGATVSKEVSALMKRGVIPEEIQELWGRYDDPAVNAAKSIGAIAQHLAIHKFFKDTVALGTAEGWLKQDGPGVIPYDARGNRLYELLPNNGMAGRYGNTPKSQYSPLAGYIGPEALKDALAQMIDDRAGHRFIQFFTQLTGYSMASKTALSWQSGMRNFWGNVLPTLMNGNIFPTPSNLARLGKAFKVAGAQFARQGSDATRAYVERAVELGVLGDSITDNLIRDLTGGFDSDKKTVGLMGKVFRTKLFGPFLEGSRKLALKTYDISGKAYNAPDEIWKIVNFEGEKTRLREMLPNAPEAEIETRAAEIVRNTMPTYSRAAEWVKVLRKFPVMAPYITFPTEMVRITFGQVQTGLDFIREGHQTGNKKMTEAGYWRLATFGAVGAVVGSIPLVARALFGFSQDDEDDLRKHLAPWEQNVTLLLLPTEDRTGAINYMNLSYMNPYDIWMRPVRAAVRGWRDPNTGLLTVTKDALTEFFDPIAKEQILFGSLIDTRRGVTATGGKVWDKTDSDFEKTRKSLTHIYNSALEPGTITSIERVIKGVTGQVRSDGKAYSGWQEGISAGLGIKATSVDLSTTLAYAAKDFRGGRLDSVSVFSRAFKASGTKTDEEIINAYVETNEKLLRTYRELYEKTVGAVRVGAMTRQEAMKVLRSEDVPADVIGDLFNNRFRRYTPGQESIQAAREKGDALGQDRIRLYREALDRVPAVQQISEDAFF